MLCQQCKFENPQDAIFCGMCGEKMKELVKTQKNIEIRKLGQKKRHDLAKQLIIQQKQ